FALMDTTPHFYLTRLDRDGNLDTFFSPVMDAPLNALAVQADGEILLGGSFSTVNGQPRLNIARLNRTQPATESLSFDGSRATWLRGGSAAEIWRAEFEATTDGVNWTTLGVGERIAGGWQLSGVSLAANHPNLRARGWVTGGYGCGSTWFLDS